MSGLTNKNIFAAKDAKDAKKAKEIFLAEAQRAQRKACKFL